MRPPILPLIFCAGLILAGCSHPTQKPPAVPTDFALHEGGLAILTPTASAGQDEDRQAVAQQLSETLTRLRPDLA
ncbi:MAG TPA: hypothetical protein VKP60_23485, partial [Magnetospirillaceae bacterium]|nr:hypothetical protein [Magnetospirillaceae bacterium]